MPTVTPEKLAANDTESGHQQALMLALVIERQAGRLLASEWLYHVANGRKRDIEDAGTLKAEGVKPGILDLCLPVACRGYHGLYIEMKKPAERSRRGGGVKPDQLRFMQHLTRHGYLGLVCYHWQEALHYIQWYLKEMEKDNAAPGIPPNPSYAEA